MRSNRAEPYANQGNRQTPTCVIEQCPGGQADGCKHDSTQATMRLNTQLKAQVARLSSELASLIHERDVLLGQVLAGPGGADEFPDLLHKLQRTGSPGMPCQFHSSCSKRFSVDFLF